MIRGFVDACALWSGDLLTHAHYDKGICWRKRIMIRGFVGASALWPEDLLTNAHWGQVTWTCAIWTWHVNFKDKFTAEPCRRAISCITLSKSLHGRHVAKLTDTTSELEFYNIPDLVTFIAAITYRSMWNIQNSSSGENNVGRFPFLKGKFSPILETKTFLYIRYRVKFDIFCSIVQGVGGAGGHKGGRGGRPGWGRGGRGWSGRWGRHGPLWGWQRRRQGQADQSLKNYFFLLPSNIMN